MNNATSRPASFASMVLLTSYYGPGQKTFKMMPVDLAAPFVECIFNNDHNVLAVIGKNKKQSLQMVQKLNEAGEPEIDKRSSQPKKQRITIETYHEYYITEAEEIREFINAFAVNAESFDWLQYFKKEEEAKTPAEEADLKEAA
jgi:hypothetical protein